MRELTVEENVLLYLLGRGIGGNTAPLSDEAFRRADWQKIMEESRVQAVQIQVFDAAAAYKKHIPADVYQEWFKRSSRSLMNNARIAGEQDRLVDLLQKAGRSCLILKGLVSAAYYPKPELRCQGDIDFLIDPAEKDTVQMLLKQSGYICDERQHDYHVGFSKSTVALEMHFNIPGVPFGSEGEKVLEFIRDIHRDAGQMQIDKHAFMAPDEARHGLILLLHMQQHMLVEGLGLRHLCDWACFVNRTAQAAFWKDLLVPLLEEIGLIYFASVMTRTCTQYFGTACPEWVVKTEDGLCKAVMLDILTGGNFGRKEKTRSKAGMLVSYKGKSGTEKSVAHNMMKTLFSATEKKYPIVKKIKVLHPVLAAWRAVLYVGRSFCGKRTSVAEMIPLAQERRSTYERLKIFETDEGR